MNILDCWWWDPGAVNIFTAVLWPDAAPPVRTNAGRRRVAPPRFAG